MSYKKRGASSEAEIAQNRLQGIKQIDPVFDFGNGLNVASYETLINEVQSDVLAYNNLLTRADGMSSQIDINEARLKDLNSRLLNAVGSKYGYNSIEYEKAGGTRTSDYKKVGKQTSAATSAHS
mgnify:CR=1 FL=1